MPNESPNELSVLQEISDKLSKLLTLTRLANSQAITEFKKKIEEDPVFEVILELADGTLSSTEMNKKAIEQTKVSERTIKSRIAELTEKGALSATRKGKEIYYKDSGLYS